MADENWNTTTSCETGTLSAAEEAGTPIPTAHTEPTAQPVAADPSPVSAVEAPVLTAVNDIMAVTTVEAVLQPATGDAATTPRGSSGASVTPSDPDASPTAQPDPTDASPERAKVAPAALAEPTSTLLPERRSIRAGDRTAPRVPSKFAIFAAGDHVVYPTHGVGKVVKVATEEIAGEKLELIHITFEENRMTLRVPISKARSAGLRKLATRKLFDEVLTLLKGRARISRTMWSRRAVEYYAKINSGDPVANAEVVRDLYRKPGKDEPSFSERQIYEAAMDRLAGELAALDETDRPTAVAKLTNWLQAASVPPCSPVVSP